PSGTNLHALMAENFKAEPDDTHLKHAVRIALRDQLLTPEAWDYVAAEKWADLEESYLADVAPGVPSAGSARFLLGYLAKYPEPLATRARYARHVARFGGPEAETGLVSFARLSKLSPIELVALLKAIQQGTQERGAAIG